MLFATSLAGRGFFGVDRKKGHKSKASWATFYCLWNMRGGKVIGKFEIKDIFVETWKRFFKTTRVEHNCFHRIS
jgi:hypothetical protein